MPLKYILPVLLVLLLIYLIAWPLYRKRPVYIQRYGLIAIMFISLFLTAQVVSMYLILLGVLISFILLFRDYALLYGVSPMQAREALKKAAPLTRSEIVENDNSYVINSDSQITFYKVSTKTTWISFSKMRRHKKNILLRKLFMKFLQNYYI